MNCYEPLITQNTTFEIGERTPELLFQCGGDITTKSAKGGALTHITVHLESLGAPEPVMGHGMKRHGMKNRVS